MCGQAQDLASIVIPIVSLSCLIVFAYNVLFCWGNLTSFWRINLLLLFDPEIHPLKTWRCEMKGFLSGSVGHCEQNWKLWLFWQDGNHTAFHRTLDKMWVTDRNQTSSVHRGWQQCRPSPWKVDRLPVMTSVPTLHTKNVITVLNQHDWGFVSADRAEYRRRGQTPPSTLVGWSFVDVFSSGVG